MKYYVWLANAFGYGSENAAKLVNEYKTAKGVYDADFDEVISKFSLTYTEYKGLCNKSLKKSEMIVEQCKQNGIEILCINDNDYPEQLRNINNPPICLYYKGILPNFNILPTLSVVGTRKADDYSIRAAWSLSARLALANCLIVSGGALGIDSAAHNGAMDVGGRTVAFLACGINCGYLKQNEELRNRIAKNGCLISEFSPDYPVKREAFHIRNRLISGISLGVIIIEAGEKSGALITARNAAEQGRDVFVITGKPDDKKYSGSYSLLRDGAIPVFKAEDILSEYTDLYGNLIDVEKSAGYNLIALYNSIYRDKKSSENEVPAASEENAKTEETKINFEKVKFTLSKNAEIVYNYIDNDFFTVDDLLPTEISVGDLFSAVTELEMSGLVTALPGGRYIKK